MTTPKLTIAMNGESHTISANTTIAQLLQGLQIDVERIAVELNGEVIRRKSHPEVTLSAGDVLEIVTFVGGG
ncbi:MAG TPA: thiamine biosynthesis protein ThiS [Myxococcales bacterium]|nr:thiamine biosynthesis protein ThiS [Myxococcales bacterium]HAN30859.1 thiamine biosynthesis protein ThiS [Myxococcales bacterium]